MSKPSRKRRLTSPPPSPSPNPKPKRQKQCEAPRPHRTTTAIQTSPFSRLPPELHLLIVAHLTPPTEQAESSSRKQYTPWNWAATCWYFRRLLHHTIGKTGKKSFLKRSTDEGVVRMPLWKGIALGRLFCPVGRHDVQGQSETPGLMPRVMTLVQEVGMVAVEVDEGVVEEWCKLKGLGNKLREFEGSLYWEAMKKEAVRRTVGTVLGGWAEMWVFGGEYEGVLDYAVVLGMRFEECYMVGHRFKEGGWQGRVGNWVFEEAARLVMHAWLVAAGMAGYPRTLEGVGWDTENTVKEVERYAMGGRFGCVLGGFKVGLDGLRAGHTLERLNKLVAATKMPKEYKGVTFRRVRVSAEGQIRVEDGQVKDWEGAGKSRWGFFKEKDLEDLVRRVNSRRERQLAMARK